MERLTLGDVTAVAWVFVGVAFLLAAGFVLHDPPPQVHALEIVFIPAGLLALPVAVVGSLLLALRRLSRPGAEHVADYGDRRAAEPHVGEDRRPDDTGRGRY